MWFLTLELWPYLLAALFAGLATGWLAGCKPRRPRAGRRQAEEAA